MAKAAETREERDSLGAVEVPAKRYWGAQTERSRRNFTIGGETMPREVVQALALIKLAAARVNAADGLLEPRLAQAIGQAAQEAIDGGLEGNFPLVIWQTGSGTQSNMNVNEVIAGRANEILAGRRGGKSPVHPNDHVNLGQSSNDSFPTAMHLAAARLIAERTIPAVAALEAAIRAQAERYAALVKIGRTHLMDATPVTLGQEMGGWAAQIAIARRSLEASLPALHELAQGGTAVGTGLNTTPGFDRRIAAELARLTGRPFQPAPDKFAALAGHEALVAASAGLLTVAVALTKVANDVRLLGSGPRAGFAELNLPENEPGSSIMPGKVNPTQAEALTQVAAQVLGNHTTVAYAASQGQLEHTVFKPVIIANVLRSARLLADAAESFRLRCIEGMTANEKQIHHHLEHSLMLVTALAPSIGYDKAAEVAKLAHREHLTLREAALRLGYVSATDFDRLVQAETMLAPAWPEGHGSSGDKRR
jgi:fumarate hydratase class II